MKWTQSTVSLLPSFFKLSSVETCTQTHNHFPLTLTTTRCRIGPRSISITNNNKKSTQKHPCDQSRDLKRSYSTRFTMSKLIDVNNHIKKVSSAWARSNITAHSTGQPHRHSPVHSLQTSVFIVTPRILRAAQHFLSQLLLTSQQRGV